MDSQRRKLWYTRAELGPAIIREIREENLRCSQERAKQKIRHLRRAGYIAAEDEATITRQCQEEAVRRNRCLKEGAVEDLLSRLGWIQPRRSKRGDRFAFFPAGNGAFAPILVAESRHQKAWGTPISLHDPQLLQYLRRHLGLTDATMSESHDGSRLHTRKFPQPPVEKWVAAKERSVRPAARLRALS